MHYVPAVFRSVFPPALNPLTPALCQVIKEVRPNVAISTDLTNCATVLSALSTRSASLVVWQESDRVSERPFFHQFQVLAMRYLARWLGSWGVRIVPRSKSAREFCFALGYPGHLVSLPIPTPVDTEVFRPEDQGFARRKLSLPEAKWILLCVSRLNYDKGLLFLLDAFQKLCQRTSNYMLVIKGDGPWQAKLRYEIEHRGLEGTVELRTSWSPITDMRLWYSAATMSLVVTRGGIFPFTALESLSCGCPVISTFGRAMYDIIRYQTTGRIVETANPSLLADAIDAYRRLLQDQGEIRERCRASIQEYASSAKVAGVLDALVKEMCPLDD